MIQTSGPVPSHTRNSYAPSQVINGHTDLFACDDPSVMAQYLQYTPLQPNRTILGIQPSTSGEEMLYPQSPPGGQYLSNPEPSHATGLGIQGNDQLTEGVDRNTAMATALTSNVTTPRLTGQATYGDLPARYDMAHGCGNPGPLLNGGPEFLESQAGPDFGVGYNPHQRTPSARRGPFKDHEKREKTAHTRRIGSCIRCRMQRIRVSLHPHLLCISNLEA